MKAKTKSRVVIKRATKDAPNGSVGGLPVVGKKPVKAKALGDGSFGVYVKPPELPTAPKKRRRRRRRRSNQLVSQRLVTEVNQKKRQFLREVSTMLTDSFGFPVRVSLLRVNYAATPDMRRAARMTKAQARRQMADSANAPVVPGKGAAVFDDDIGF